MSISLFATKIGMSQIFMNFKRIPVTILKIDENLVLNKFFSKINNRYILQMGYQNMKSKNVSKPLLGYFNKMSVQPKRYIKEFSVDQNTYENINIGNELNIKNITDYKYLRVSGLSIGKGFAGVMKRHNFKGFPASHGTHEMFRHGGSIGCRTSPGRVFKGKKMAGRMGHKKVTIKNIKIVKYIEDNHYLLIKGGTPGCARSILTIECYNI
jgi:large subunit ribosomal protein L3